MLLITTRRFFAVLLIVAANGDVLREGEYCGVQGEDYLIDDFTGPVAIAGNGCESQSNTNCLCAPNFDNTTLFIWKCNGDVIFGPENGKFCPLTVPVVKKVGVSSSSFSDLTVDIREPCNTSIHPTGYPGDASCGYSECESGGKFSAVCGCVDFGKRNSSYVATSGMHWVCLHGTCACSLPSDDGEDDEPIRLSTSASVSIPIMFAAITPYIALMIAY